MRKFVTLATVGTIGFVAGAYWTCVKICQMVDAGIDVTAMANKCMDQASREAEVKVRKWGRKYSEPKR